MIGHPGKHTSHNFINIQKLSIKSPKWLLKAEQAFVIMKGNIKSKSDQKPTLHLDKAFFYPCSFETLKESEKASIYFSSNSIKLVEDQIILKEVKLHVSPYELTLPNLVMNLNDPMIGYFDFSIYLYELIKCGLLEM